MPLQVDSSTFAATIQFAEKVKLWSGNCTSPSSMVTSACLIFGKGRKGTKSVYKSTSYRQYYWRCFSYFNCATRRRPMMPSRPA